MSEGRTSIFMKGISVQTTVTVVMGVLEMVVFSFMSRLLTQTDFGYFAALSGVLTIFSCLASAGLGSAVIQKKDATQQFVSTAYTLGLSLGLLMFVVAFLASPWLARIVADDCLTKPLRLMSVSLLFNSIISIGNAQLYRELKFKRIGIIAAISYTISSSFGIFLAYKGLGLWAIIIYNLLNSLLIILFTYTTSVPLPKLGFSKADAGNIISFGGWLTAGVMLNTVTGQLDKLLMPKWISVKALGAYNRPAGFTSTVSGKIQSIFDVVLFPMLSDLQDNPNRVKDIFFRAISLLNSFSIILAAIFFFNAELIIRIFFGAQWLDLVPVMQIVSVSVIFSIDSQLVDCFFRSLNLLKLGFFLRLFGIVETFTFLFFGAKYGITGVAVSLVAANILLVLVKMIALNIKIDAGVLPMFTKWIKSWKPVIPLLILGFAFISVTNHSVLYSVIFAIVFAAIIIIEFLFIPSMVSSDYKDTIYPRISEYVPFINGSGNEVS